MAPCGPMAVWGWSLAWWYGGCPWWVFCAGGFLGRGGVLTPEGRGGFFLDVIHFGVGSWPSVST